MSRVTQVNYETGKRGPDGNYLHALGTSGVDVGFVLFGVRSTPGNLYSLGVARVLPRITDRAGINWDALSAILSIAAEDEASSWGGMTGALVSDEKLGELVRALFEQGALLGRVFRAIDDALHELDASLPARRKVDVVLTLLHAFSARGAVDKKLLNTAVRIAVQTAK